MAFPAVRAGGTNPATTTSAANALTLAVAYPAPTGGIQAGDLLVAFAGIDGNPTLSWPAGWTEKKDQAGNGSAVRGGCAVMVAAGGETGTFTLGFSASEGGSVHVYCIEAGTWEGTVAGVEVSTGVGAATANPGPDSLTPSWGAADTLWIAATAGDAPNGPSAGPASYTGFVATHWTSAGSGAGIATARRELNATSENPGAFTRAAEDSLAWTTAIRPAGASGTAFPRTATDSVIISETATRAAVARARTAADSATVSEAATRSTPKARTVTDSVAVSDAAVATRGTSRAAADSITAADAAARVAVTRVRTGTDTASVSDSAARSSGRARTATDAVTVSDAAARAATTRARTAAETVSIADGAVVSGSVSNLTRTAADSVTATDAATRSTPKARSATDNAVVTDQAARAALTRARTSADAAAVTDQATRLTARQRAATDALSVTESATGVPVRTRAAGDTVTVADVLARGPLLRVRVADDAVVLTDSATGLAIGSEPTVWLERPPGVITGGSDTGRVTSGTPGRITTPQTGRVR